MDGLKIIRSLCLFTHQPSEQSIARVKMLAQRLDEGGFTVQTQRLCSPDVDSIFDIDGRADGTTFLSVGRLGWEQSIEILDRFCSARNVAFNLDLSNEAISAAHVSLLTDIIRKNAAKTFSFTYTFNNALSSPYFPSATYERNGFAVGLQPTDLSIGVRTIEEWLSRMQTAWHEIDAIMESEEDYLGVDTSIAPLFDGRSSLINFVSRLGLDFSRVVTSDFFLRIADFLNERGSRRVGLCGLMFACLEDFELAAEYEKGNFSVERCLFLSLQSGLGIDAYPVGVDEDPERIADVLRLTQGLSNKHRKPLSARFISDGMARIGDQTALANPYLKDVIVRPL